MIPLIIAIGAAIAGLAVITLALLNWDRIIDWFHGREQLKISDMDNIAFTLHEKLKNGQHKTVQGIFNKRTNKLLDGEKIMSSDIDEQLAEVHAHDELVVYE